MSLYSKYREVHSWVGFILMIPITVIAVTGFLWNHEKTLGIKREDVRTSSHDGADSLLETAVTDDERQPALLASETGAAEMANHLASALRAARQEWGAVLPLDRVELKDDQTYGLVVKVKSLEGEETSPREIVWSASANCLVERKGGPHSGTDWAKVVHDLHTGKFFSRQLGFLWSDSGAISIILLGLTGVVLFFFPAFKKLANRRKTSKPLDGSAPLTTKLPRRDHPIIAPSISNMGTDTAPNDYTGRARSTIASLNGDSDMYKVADAPQRLAHPTFAVNSSIERG